MNMSEIIVYASPNCSDCRRAKQFLSERGVAYREVNIAEDKEASDLVIRVNHGKRKTPTFAVDGRFFSSSPFDPYQLSEELQIPLNP